MKLIYRRIYAFGFIFLFVVIAPLLIFYASGFRYDLGQKRIIRTGVLTVDSKPRGATITLNGKTLKKETPTVIKNLIPQEYRVELKTDGYYSWQKTLTVYPHEATLTNKVTLIKKNEAVLFLKENVTDFQISPRNSYLAYLTPLSPSNFSLALKRLNEKREIIRLPLFSEITPVLHFSQDESNLFVTVQKEGQKDHLIFLIQAEINPVFLSEISILNFSRVKDYPLEEKKIMSQSNGALYLLDLEQKKEKLLLEDNVDDFIIRGNDLFYISRNAESSHLKKLNLTNRNSPQELMTLKKDSSYLLAINPNGIITLLDQTENQLTLLELRGEFDLKLIQLNPEINDLSWSPDYQNLLFFNDFELWVMNLKTEEQQMLLRSSEEIQASEWFFDQNWIIFQQNKKLKAIEIDGRDKRYIFDLTENQNGIFSIDHIENRILFIGQSENSQGLYVLDLD